MEKKLHSAVPIYAAGLAVALYGLLFPLYAPLHILLSLVLGAAVYLLLARWIPDKIVRVEPPVEAFSSGQRDVDEQLREAREQLLALQALEQRIQKLPLHAQIVRMRTAATDILRSVAEKPERIGLIRRFLNYYLPTTVKLLTHYADLPEAAALGHIQRSRQAIEDNAEQMARAFEKQLDSLYADTALDISTDLDVLDTLLGQENLK